jgi:hypothetical protein
MTDKPPPPPSPPQKPPPRRPPQGQQGRPPQKRRPGQPPPKRKRPPTKREILYKKLNAWLEDSRAVSVTVLIGLAALMFTLRAVQTPEPPPPDPLLAGQYQSFYNNCVRAVLEMNVIPGSCATRAGIEKNYGVNIDDVMAANRARMINTARKIARGDILDDKAYRACIDRGECVDFPMAPEGDRKDPSRMNRPENVAKRRLFWHLVNDGSMTPEVCAAMDVCRALQKIGIDATVEKKK